MPQYVSPFVSSELKSLETVLVEKGFVPYPHKNPENTPETIWAKKMPDVNPKCNTNGNISLHVSLSEWGSPSMTFVTMNIVGGTQDDFWTDFKFYAIKPEFMKHNLDVLANKLIRAWQTMATEIQ